jgi:hypothetical protein
MGSVGAADAALPAGASDTDMISVAGPVSMIWVEPASDGEGAVNRRSAGANGSACSTGSADGMASVGGAALDSSPVAGAFSSGPDGFDMLGLSPPLARLH